MISIIVMSQTSKSSPYFKTSRQTTCELIICRFPSGSAGSSDSDSCERFVNCDSAIRIHNSKMDTHDIILTVACGAAAQSSWWTMSTAAAYLYFLMPNVTPSFWVALVFGCGGGLSALLTFILPPRVQHTAESTQAIASFVLQAAATGAILAVCVLHTHVFGSTSRTVAEQQALLSVVAALFFVASMASFRAQEILNGVLNGYGKDYVPWFWRGGTVCALLMGCLQLILRTLVPKSEAGITFLGVGTFISLCGVPAFAAIRRPVAERQPLLADQVQVPDKGKSLTAWEVFVVGRVPLICAGVDFGYMMVRLISETLCAPDCSLT